MKYVVLLLCALLSVGASAQAQHDSLKTKFGSFVGKGHYREWLAFPTEGFSQFHPVPKIALDTNTIYGLSSGGTSRLLRTTDAGKTWRQLFGLPPGDIDDPDGADVVFSISMPTPSRILMTAGKGRVIVTHDAGETFTTVDFNTFGISQPRINLGSMLDSNRGVVGEILEGLIWHTTDGGLTWSSLNVPDSVLPDTRAGMTNLIYLNDSTIIAQLQYQQNGWILRIENGKYSHSSIPPAGAGFGHMRQKNGDTLFIPGANGPIPGSFLIYDRILRSVDGGKTWHYVQYDTTTWGSSRMSFSPRNDGFGISLGRRFWFTQNHGASWYVDTTLYGEGNEARGGYLFHKIFDDGAVLAAYSEAQGMRYMLFHPQPEVYSPSTGVQPTETIIPIVYPNPASDRVHFGAPLRGTIRVVDAGGREVWQGHSEEGLSWLNVSHYSAGVYFVHSGTGNNIARYAFVVQR